jgi:2'-hydroxyisoflavone reductase
MPFGIGKGIGLALERVHSRGPIHLVHALGEEEMRILIIGGGVFLGRALLDAALGRGHRVGVFNRGRARQEWPAGVDVLTGDRRGDLAPLAAAGPWDAVIDTCGYCPADVLPTAHTLAACPRYLFVSSVSAYATHSEPGLSEDTALSSAEGLAPDAPITGETYGPLKAECERALTRVLGARLLVVRPGLIVGPGDPTGRFSYWAWRAAAGGRMLVPAAPAGSRLQVIDVRDLAGWMIDLLEQDTGGSFNAIGPTDSAATLGWPELIGACLHAAHTCGHIPAMPIPVSEGLLVREKVEPWTELPLWLPAGDPELAGFMSVDLGRAAAHGLRTRSIEDTARDIVAAGLPPPDDWRRAGKLTPAREAELLRIAAA